MSGTEEQRLVSPVAGTGKPLLSKKLLTAGLVVAVGGVMGFVLWRNANPAEGPVKERLPTQLGSTLPYSPPKLLVPPPAQVQAQAYQPPPQPLLLPQRDPASRAATQASAYPSPHMMTYAAAVPGPPASGDSGAPGSPGNASGVSYVASHVDGVKAGLLGDQTFLLMPGLIGCEMDTAINSQFEGPVQCHITGDIKPHGVTLLGRGSIIHGYYRNNIATGQSRIFVAADWVHDPSSGCYMSFQNAPVADLIGQSGVQGNVDNKYLERFGAAMLLTLGQGGESLAQAALSKGGNTYLSFNGGSGGLDTIASAILRKQIDIPPEITVHQGQQIAVFSTKVLDFSPCYSLALKKG